jgi:hypothetical protein
MECNGVGRKKGRHIAALYFLFDNRKAMILNLVWVRENGPSLSSSSSSVDPRSCLLSSQVLAIINCGHNQARGTLLHDIEPVF